VVIEEIGAVIAQVRYLPFHGRPPPTVLEQNLRIGHQSRIDVSIEADEDLNELKKDVAPEALLDRIEAKSEE
jgi:hypothetical protein